MDPVPEQPVDFNSWPAEDALCAAALLDMDLSPFLNSWRVHTGLNAKLQLLETIRFLLSTTEDALDLGAYWEECPTQVRAGAGLAAERGGPGPGEARSASDGRSP